MGQRGERSHQRAMRRVTTACITGKVRYSSKKYALQVAAECRARSGESNFHAYKCKHCKNWHCGHWREHGLPVPNFAPPRDTLTAHEFNREPHCTWCEECFRQQGDPIHTIRKEIKPVAIPQQVGV